MDSISFENKDLECLMLTVTWAVKASVLLVQMRWYILGVCHVLDTPLGARYAPVEAKHTILKVTYL